MGPLRLLGIVVLAGLGVFFTFVSTVGVIRLPDVYARAHTASQVDTLGAGFALAAVALGLGWDQATVYTVLLLFFVFITNPTAAHAIARSADESGIEPVTADDAEAGTTSASNATDEGTESVSADRDADGGTDVATDGGTDVAPSGCTEVATSADHGGERR